MTEIQVRRGTASVWTSTNPVLAAGEFGYETDTSKVKLGDGATVWASLAYIGAGSGAVASVFGRTGTVAATSGDYTVSQVTGAAPLASPALTGSPTAPTQSSSDNSTKVATTAYVKSQSSGSSGGFPAINATAVTASGALTPGQYTKFDATSGALTITLPTGQTAGTIAVVEKIDATANTVTFTGNIRDVGSSTVTLSGQHETHVFEVDSTGSWFVPASHKPLSMLDARYAPADAAGLMYPMFGTPWAVTSYAATANIAYGRRTVAPISRTVSNLYVWVGTLSPTGTVSGAVYDTGDAASGTRTLLASGTSANVATLGGSWVPIPILTPGSATLSLKPQQQVDFAIFCSGTPTLGGDTFFANGAFSLPSGLGPVPGGVTPTVLAWQIAESSWPSTISPTTTTGKPYTIIA